MSGDPAQAALPGGLAPCPSGASQRAARRLDLGTAARGPATGLSGTPFRTGLAEPASALTGTCCGLGEGMHPRLLPMTQPQGILGLFGMSCRLRAQRSSNRVAMLAISVRRRAPYLRVTFAGGSLPGGSGILFAQRERHSLDCSPINDQDNSMKHPSEDSIGWALAHAARLHRSHLNEKLSDIGLVAGQEQVLQVLDSHGTLTLRKLAAILRVRIHSLQGRDAADGPGPGRTLVRPQRRTARPGQADPEGTRRRCPGRGALGRGREQHARGIRRRGAGAVAQAPPACCLQTCRTLGGDERGSTLALMPWTTTGRIRKAPAGPIPCHLPGRPSNGGPSATLRG